MNLFYMWENFSSSTSVLIYLFETHSIGVILCLEGQNLKKMRTDGGRVKENQTDIEKIEKSIENIKTLSTSIIQ